MFRSKPNQEDINYIEMEICRYTLKEKILKLSISRLESELHTYILLKQEHPNDIVVIDHVDSRIKRHINEINDKRDELDTIQNIKAELKKEDKRGGFFNVWRNRKTC